MPQRLFIVAVVLGLLFPDALAAQEAASWPLDKVSFDPARGPGGYLALYKLGFVWLVFAAFVYLADWVNYDVQQLKLGAAKWNGIVVGTFLIGWLLLSVIPWFWLAFVLYVACGLGPVVAYTFKRNKSVTDDEKVLTRDHALQWAAPLLKRLGVKVPDKAASGKGQLPIEILAKGGANDGENKATSVRLTAVKGFHAAQQLLIDIRSRRASAAVLDYSQTSVAVQFQIDGVLNNAPAKTREGCDPMLEVLKSAAGLNPKERVQRQQGFFEIKHEKGKYHCKLVSQGTPTGERVLVQVDDGFAQQAKLDNIGLRPKQQEDLKKALMEKEGLVLVSAPSGKGLSSLFTATITGVDRFMRSAVGVEHAKAHEIHVENVPVTTYDADAGQSPMTVLPGLARQYPDVYAIHDFVNGETLTMLCKEVTDEKRLVIGTIQAKEVAESIIRALMLKVPTKNLAMALTACVNGRLVRKLCEGCKQAYTPPAELLQKLRVPPEKAQSFYRVPPPKAPVQGEKPTPPCSQCGGVGYFGRTGIFELLIVNNDVRQAIANKPSVESVRQAAQKAGMPTLQEEAIALVVRGVTSLEEIMRALKE